MDSQRELEHSLKRTLAARSELEGDDVRRRHAAAAELIRETENLLRKHKIWSAHLVTGLQMPVLQASARGPWLTVDYDGVLAIVHGEQPFSWPSRDQGNCTWPDFVWSVVDERFLAPNEGVSAALQLGALLIQQIDGQGEQRR